MCVCHPHDFRFCLFVRLVLLPDILWLLFRIEGLFRRETPFVVTFF